MVDTDKPCIFATIDYSIYVTGPPPKCGKTRCRERGLGVGSTGGEFFVGSGWGGGRGGGEGEKGKGKGRGGLTN